MKKEKLKKFIIYVFIILIGVGFFIALCERAEQVDRMEVNYEESY